MNRHRSDIFVAGVDDVADRLNRERERLDATFKDDRERADAGRFGIRIQPSREADRRDDLAAQVC